MFDERLQQCYCHMCMLPSGIGAQGLDAVITANRCLTAVCNEYSILPRYNSLTVRNLAQAHTQILRHPLAGAKGLYGSDHPTSRQQWNRLGAKLHID